MTSRDFCIWLKGVVVASHHFNLTPKAWECVRAELELVNDDLNPVNEIKPTLVTPNWVGRDIIKDPYFNINTDYNGTGGPYFATPTTTSIVSKKEQLND